MFLSAGAAVLFSLTLAVTPAHAEPSVAEIEAQMDKKWEELEPTIEKYNKVHGDLKDSQKKAAELEKQMQPLTLEVDLAMNKVGEIAARSYKAGPASELNSILITGSPSTLAEQLSLLDRLASDERAKIEDVAAKRNDLSAQKAELDKLVEEQKAQDADLAAKKKEIEKEIADLEKMRIAAYGTSSSGGALRIGACPRSYPGGAAGVAVKTACAQIGKPYVYGAGGPGSFDCSGLTSFAWAKAGVSLPHNAAAQYGRGTKVSRANAKPGDLVFFRSDLSHVGMYVGDGLMVHAPRTGKDVMMASIDIMPIVGFRRYG